MSRQPSSADTQPGLGVALRVTADVCCLGCGCLCDDIQVHLQGDAVVAAPQACPLGFHWLKRTGGSDRPSCTIEGKPASPEDSLARAAAILTRSRRPLVTGLVCDTIEATQAAAALADALGATIDPLLPAAAAEQLAAIQRAGLVSATLGEVKNRADLVIYWMADPLTTQPRHLERYTIDAAGLFAPGFRRLLVATAGPTATSARAHDVWPLDPTSQLEALDALRLALAGIEAPPGRAAQWAGWMKQARYGAIFFDDTLAALPGGSAAVESLLRLVRQWNETTRGVALPLGQAGNPAGAEAVLTWQMGYPRAIDLSRGYPRYLPGEADAATCLEQGWADAVLVVGRTERLPAGTPRVPTIVIAPGATAMEPSVAVGIETDEPGLSSGGTVVRCDGLSLPLRPFHSPAQGSSREWLERLHDQIRRTQEGG